MAARILPWMFGLVLLAGATLLSLQPSFGLFGRAYGVGGAGMTAAFVPPISTPAGINTPVSPVVDAQPSSAMARTPTPAATLTPLFTATTAPSMTPATVSTTPQAATSPATRLATSTPVAMATARNTRTPAVSEPATPGPTPCLPARPALKFEPHLQRAPAGSPVKVRFALQNASTGDVGGAILRVVNVSGTVDVSEVWVGDGSPKRLLSSPSEVLLTLPPLPGSTTTEVVLLLETRAEAELRLEVMAPDCGRRGPEATASARLLLVLPATRDEASVPAPSKAETKESSVQEQSPPLQVSSGEKR